MITEQVITNAQPYGLIGRLHISQLENKFYLHFIYIDHTLRKKKTTLYISMTKIVAILHLLVHFSANDYIEEP